MTMPHATRAAYFPLEEPMHKSIDRTLMRLAIFRVQLRKDKDPARPISTYVRGDGEVIATLVERVRAVYADEIVVLREAGHTSIPDFEKIKNHIFNGYDWPDAVRNFYSSTVSVYIFLERFRNKKSVRPPFENLKELSAYEQMFFSHKNE